MLTGRERQLGTLREGRLMGGGPDCGSRMAARGGAAAAWPAAAAAPLNAPACPRAPPTPTPTQVGLLAPAGPFSLLDLFPLTQRCGEECSTDGVHSRPEVYDAALQLLLGVYAAGPERSAEAAGQAAEEELHAARRQRQRQRRRRRALHG